MNQEGVIIPSPEMVMLRNNKQSGYKYRYRRHFDWDENYELYRDKVMVNRLTQTQSVNLPLMKSTLGTTIKENDDMPVIYFENLDNNKQAELFKNEYWKKTVEHNHMELQDVVDKKQASLYGRTFDQWQIVDGWVKMTIQDPYDILVSRYCDPFYLHSSRFLIHTNIFVPLSSLRENPDYDVAAVKDMEDYYATQQGLIRSAENQRLFIEKNQRMADLGVQDIFNPILGETYVMLTLHFVWKNQDINTDGSITEFENQIYQYTEADNMRILMKKPLEEVIGTTADHYWKSHFPYTTWAPDLERQDFWSDGVADIARTPNKILNAWFSQMVTNRTLTNFGMNYYNSNLDFIPPTIEPAPGAWIGLPIPPNGDIDSVFKKVDIPNLSDTLPEMNFLLQMVQSGTGATPTEEGQIQPTQVTLGQVQLSVNEAKSKIKGMSKFYTPAWQDRGMMFLKLVEAAPDKLENVMIYRKGLNSSNVFKRLISAKDWSTPSGYGIKIWSQEQKTAMDTDALNKLNAVKANMPDNQKLQEIYDRKLLEFADLKPDEINEVIQEEQKKQEAAAQGQGKPQPKESVAINYKDAPPDIQMQMEQAAGFTPSKMHNMGGMGQQPQLGPGGQPTQPNGGMPSVPPHIPSNTAQIHPNDAMPAGV